MIKVTNHLGSVVTSTYDLLNRKLTDITDGKKTLAYSYDAKGQLVSTHDSFTDKTDLSKYDGMGLVIETTDKLGNVSKTAYDAKGQVIKLTDALGNTSTKEYDLYGNVIKETNALGHSKQTKYNALGLVIQEVDERGFSTSYKYNDKFQPVEVTDKLGKIAKFTYNAQGYVAEAINQNGHATTYEYDLYGQTTKETDPNGNIKTNEYDLLGNVVKATEPNRTVIHNYDSLGRLVSTKRNNKTTVTNEYNELNQIIKSTNALDYATNYEYDIYGNTTKETFVDYVTVNTYDINSQLIKTVENTDKITTFEYDALGRELNQVQNGRDMLVQSYDAAGNVISKTEKGVTVKFAYDANSQVTEHKYPALNNADEFKTIVSIKYDESGNQIEFKDIYDNVLKRGYDANNNVISETNTRGFTTKYEYDSLSNMTKVQSPLERVVKYEYDGNNNLLKRIYNDKEALYSYDENNNLINEISEYGLKESYSYDADGNQTSKTKNDGTEIRYSYDAMGRKLSEGSRSFEYDPYDNVTKASYNKKSIEYTYDKYNNIIKVDDANNNVVEYKWDIYGNRTELKYKDNTIGYTYNQFDKMNKVVKNGNDYAEYSYDARGNTSSVVRNGITTSYSYDELNRRTEYVNKKGDETLSAYKYAYDGENNIISETVNNNKNTYTYNESDELKTSSKTIDGRVINTEYKYDLFGNKIESSSDGSSKVYRYNDKNQLTSVKSKEGLTDIYYDKNGNIRDIYYAGGYKEYYQYDEFDQLTTLKSNKDREWNYQYDAEGDRIHEEKIVLNRYALDYEKDSVEWYDYVQTLPFEEVKELLKAKDSKETFDAMKYQLKYRQESGLCVSNSIKNADAKTEDCTYTNYVLDKTVEDTLILSSGSEFNIYGEERLSTESEEKRLTYLGSLNQSVMQTVKDDLKFENPKQTLSSIEYDDAGNTVDIKSGFGYNGEKLDETGNIYLRARYYNPRIGQFVQIDSSRGSQEEITSQNRYTYVLNNQYKYVDKNGHFPILGAIVIGALLVGLTGSTAKKKNAGAGAIAGGAIAGFDVISGAAPKPTPKPTPDKTTTGKENATTSDKNKATNTTTKVVEPEPCPEPVSSKALDVLQFILDIIGFLPVAGDICDGINALIYYARGMAIDAIISVGCIVFSVVADTILKPLKWAAGKAVDIAKKIIDKLPDFPKKTISFVKSLPSKVKQIPLVRKGYDTVNSLCNKLSNYIDDLFSKVSKKINVKFTGERKITDVLYNKLRGKTPSDEIKNSVNKNIDKLIGTPDEALGEIITGRLEADHIISMDRLTKIDGFQKLSFEQQLAILNDPQNFIGLTKSANASKGSKTFAEWTMHVGKGIKVNEAFRQRMIKKEKSLEKYFIDKISSIIN